MKCALFSMLLLSLASPALAETTLLASSRTRKVVVYAKQALVTRSLILKDLKVGAVQVRVLDLPTDLFPEFTQCQRSG